MSDDIDIHVETLPDGRLAITDETIQNNDGLLAILERMPNYWIRDEWFHGFTSPLPEAPTCH